MVKLYADYRVGHMGKLFPVSKAGGDADRRFLVYGVQVVFGDVDAFDHHRIYATQKGGAGD